ncbi:MAG TPA: response regulator transcription factor [Sulfuricurvum sp.]|nr:response regulator transcription factor [Sulfuricurvum sp.]
MKILLLENTYSFANSISNFLTALGHEVIHLDGRVNFVDIVRSGTFDLFLLDINTSTQVGADSIKDIVKFFPTIPIILLSANHDMEIIETALDLGCSDYLKKPFELKELELRLRRFNTNIFPIKSSLITLSPNYTYDTNSCSLFYQGKIQIFTKKETILIASFMLNRNKIMSEEQIALSVWNDTRIESTAIRSLVTRCRQKLKEDFIQNIRGIGYRWVDSDH